MREDIILASTARRLRSAGLRWQPQVGDWCTLLDGVREDQTGIWLVINADPEVGWADVTDAAGQWPRARIAAKDALWLPTGGQLRSWLRAHSYQVTTLEGADAMIAAPAAGPPSQPRSSRQGWAAAILNDRQPAPQSPFFPDPAQTIVHRCRARHPGDSIGTGPSGPVEATGLSESETVAEVVMRILMADPHRPAAPAW
ncbi:MAG TPA: hypothetical protein VKB76_08195 [Ktedonobacterales bacterium]|nr:hypothetical protein [Ktedonobacterales bacterium]